MSIPAAIAALFQAATAALRVIPWLAAWLSSRDLERITQRILKHEARNTPLDRRLADELRVHLPIRRRLNDALLAALPGDPGGDRDRHVTRAIPVPD
jgi:hypothetical protein